MITITAFNWVPDIAKGKVRDLRVRWALEEAGLPYHVKLIDHVEKTSDAYRALQPFCQVPAYEDEAVTLFESGAIVLHIAEKSDALLPKDGPVRARAISWMFAALNSVEPPIETLAQCKFFFAAQPWTKEARPTYEALVRKRMADIALCLKDREWLEDRFTAGDLMMGSVLRRLTGGGLLSDDLAAYVARCEARPAFQRALAAHLADFTGSPPPGFA